MLNRHFQMQLFCLRFKDYIMAKVILLLLNKTTPHFQVFPMPKVDQSLLRMHEASPIQ